MEEALDHDVKHGGDRVHFQGPGAKGANGRCGKGGWLLRWIGPLLAAVLALISRDTATLLGHAGSPAVSGTGAAASAPLDQPDAATRGRVRQAYGRLPLYFEANRGQTDLRVKFLSRGSGYSLFLTPTEAVLSLRQESRGVGAVVRMHLVGAHPAPPVEGLEPLPGKSHYFIGNDPGQWHTEILHYAQIRYSGIYPGIDLVFHGNQRRLEYDFVVAPGADPQAIRLSFEGAGRLSLDDEGNLILHTAGGKLLQRAPVIYQKINGTKRAISGRYQLLGLKTQDPRLGTQKVGFEVDAYNPTSPLVIDPVLEYSTFLGGSSDDAGIGIAVDSSGNAYVTGWSSSTDFPTKAPLQKDKGGGGFFSVLSDAFVVKLDSTGSALVYATYLGGGSSDVSNGIAVDSSGNAYLTGYTSSTDFPTKNPFQGKFGGDSDIFVAKLNPDGSALVYSTYFGGSKTDIGNSIAVDESGSAYVTGNTDSPTGDFPTKNPLQKVFGGGSDAFVVKLDPAGSAPVYATFLGGSSGDVGNGIAVDSSGNAYLTGYTYSKDFPTEKALQPRRGNPLLVTSSDAFMAKLDPTGSALVYSTFLGGDDEDFGFDIAVDGSGNAYVTGETKSIDFPTRNPFQERFGGGLFDAFVAKLDPAGSALVYSTFLGGNDKDVGFGIAVDTSGNAYVTGETQSSDFPTRNPFQERFGGGLFDAFVAKLDPAGSALVYSTFLGGTKGDLGNGIAVDSSGNAYMTGETESLNFQSTTNSFQEKFGGGFDAFVVKLDLGSPGPIRSTYVSTAGNDANDGSLNAPWRTIQHALELAQPGQTVYVRGGAYNETLEFRRSGAPDAPITLSGYPGEAAGLDGTGLNRPIGVYLGDYDNLIVQNLTVRNYTGTGVGGGYNNDNVTLRNLEISSADEAIGFNSSSHITIENVTASQYSVGIFLVGFSDVIIRNVRLMGPRDGGEGVGIHGSKGNRLLVEKVTMESHPSFVLKLFADNVTVHQVEARGYSDWGPLLNGANVTIENSLFGGQVGALLLTGVGPYTLRNNLFHTGPNGNYSAFIVPDNPPPETSPIPVTLIGNIFYILNNANILILSRDVKLQANDNLYYSPQQGNLKFGEDVFSPEEINNGTWSRSMGTDEASRYADPLFIDANAGNYQLQEGSPAIDIVPGDQAPPVDLLDRPRPQGGGAEIGPYELGVQATLTVSKSGTGSGTVTSSPAGIDCGEDCSEGYEAGTAVTLTAKAEAGSTFAGWRGACSGTGVCTLTLDRAMTATVLFVKPLTLGTSALEGEVGVAYHSSLGIGGGLAPYTIRLVKGALPSGLDLTSEGLIGTPTKAGSSSFTMQVTDALNASASQKVSMKVLKAVGIATKSLAKGKVRKKYSAALKATGGKGPYTWSSPGALPEGLSLDPSTGKIAGTPVGSGSYNLTFQVTDALGGMASTSPLTLDIK